MVDDGERKVLLSSHYEYWMMRSNIYIAVSVVWWPQRISLTLPLSYFALVAYSFAHISLTAAWVACRCALQGVAGRARSLTCARASLCIVRQCASIGLCWLRRTLKLCAVTLTWRAIIANSAPLFARTFLGDGQEEPHIHPSELWS